MASDFEIAILEARRKQNNTLQMSAMLSNIKFYIHLHYLLTNVTQ